MTPHVPRAAASAAARSGARLRCAWDAIHAGCGAAAPGAVQFRSPHRVPTADIRLRRTLRPSTPR